VALEHYRPFVPDSVGIRNLSPVPFDLAAWGFRLSWPKCEAFGVVLTGLPFCSPLPAQDILLVVHCLYISAYLISYVGHDVDSVDSKVGDGLHGKAGWINLVVVAM
jgi:hypothetical protein